MYDESEECTAVAQVIPNNLNVHVLHFNILHLLYIRL